jgi:hypothetical protein
MRNALAKQRTAVPAMLKTIFGQEAKAGPRPPWVILTEALREN